MNLVPIGRFSKMTRLSVKALRLYDEIGLLNPARVDPSSGYRYYELGQANRAEAVRILRSVDMPLDEIRAVLDEDDPELVHEQPAGSSRPACRPSGHAGAHARLPRDADPT